MLPLAADIVSQMSVDNGVLQQTVLLYVIILYRGFATADILPCCLVELDKRLQPYKSLICNTVHDSIVIDCHPDEELHVLEILKVSMLGVAADLQKRYKIKYLMPVEIEIKKGKNWLDTEVVYPVE